MLKIAPTGGDSREIKVLLIRGVPPIFKGRLIMLIGITLNLAQDAASANQSQ